MPQALRYAIAFGVSLWEKTRSKRWRGLSKSCHAAGFTQLLETLRVACFPIGVRYRYRHFTALSTVAIA
ncbi:hypothetical protein [Nostoc sp.]|uniref:hypothetical protein n=1 Tax=Nostoc sp. TaxID=1180 RepID=UPI002FF76A73